ncbi:hypothetical protein BC834DRAFT_402269 [Gloeopeniophorella convolvens]|nr:hypothetical protein BC834DRAFT_402269 [Gloeopeniophorella convolvens]
MSTRSQPPSDIARHAYVRPELNLVITPVPTHWDVSSQKDTETDISADDGYVLSATGDASAAGYFLPCDALELRAPQARRTRLRIKPRALQRAAPSPGLASPSPTTPTAFRFRDTPPASPLSPDTDFRTFFDALRQRDGFAKLAASAGADVLPPSPPATPPPAEPASPASSTSDSPAAVSPRSARPVLRVQTTSPVGTSAPPPTPALPSPAPTPSPTSSSSCPSSPSPSPRAAQFRPSGRLPKRAPLPQWPEERYYPRAVAV